MNKPIRTISIFCLLLFLALMVNATFLQYYRAGALEEDPRNRRVLAASFSGDRGAILVGREPVAESVPTDDQYEFQRRYPQPFKYAHITGWFNPQTPTPVETRYASIAKQVSIVGKLIANAIHHHSGV